MMTELVNYHQFSSTSRGIPAIPLTSSSSLLKIKSLVIMSPPIRPLLPILDHAFQVHYINKARDLELNGLFLFIIPFFNCRGYLLFVEPPTTILSFIQPTVSKFLQIQNGKLHACWRLENTTFRNGLSAKRT